MSNSNYMFYMLFLFFCLLIFLKNLKYLLMTLIGLEFIVVWMILILHFYMLESLNWFSLFYMIISVCDGVVGLALVVNMVNFYGNQNIKNLNLMWY